MERHAGFAAAVTVAEAYVNQMLGIEFQKLDPIAGHQLFQIPAVAAVPPGHVVRLSGIGLFDPRPTVKFATNPTNAVDTSASAVVFVTAALEDGEGTILAERTAKVRITTSVRASVDIEVATEGLYLRWVPTGSVIDALHVTELEGADLPNWLIQALNSEGTRAALNGAMHHLGPVRVTGVLFPRNLYHVKSAHFESVGVSLFEWFTINESIDSASVRILDGCATVGINLRNFPHGNASQLVDLNVYKGDSVAYTWKQTVYYTADSRPLLEPRGVSDGDVSVLVNANVVRTIVDKVSAQIAGTLVAPGIKISRIAMRPAFFQKPLRGRELGLKVDFTFNHYIAGDISGWVYLQFFSFAGGWFVYVGHTEVDVPWWVDVGVAALGITLASAFPMFSPLIVVGVIAAIDGIIPGLIGNGTTAADRALGQGEPLASGVATTAFPGPRGEVTNYKGTKSVHLSSEGLGMAMIDVIPSVRFAKSDAHDPVATLTCRVDAGKPDPYTFRLSLRDDLAALAPNCSVQIIVYRADTNVEVGRREGPFATHRSLSLNHLTQSLYFVDAFRVQARIFLNRIALEGLMFAVDTTVAVTDDYDRHHPYVTWSAHAAHFRNPNGPPPAYWHRDTYPHIHRTAASARCLVLRQRVARQARFGFGIGVTYRDALDFDSSQIPFNRKMLCDYCFFGGPTKTEPFPQTDWFTK